jgi:hypothetical protein
MKNLSFSQFSLASILLLGLVSCEKNEAVQTQTEPENIAVVDEIYNAKTTGKIIDAVYNGNDVTLLEIENGKYLYDGDIVLEKGDFSLPGEVNNKGVYSGGNWPNRTVRWRFASGVSTDLRNKWATATAAWARDLGFKFTQITSNTGDYILVQQNADGSAFSTSIGRRGGQQIISVDPNSFSAGSVIHEIGHAVGLIHEQKRPDRDRFITINDANIRPRWKSQYAPCSGCTANGTFDFNSIMLYGARGGSSVVFDTNIPAMTRKDGTTWTANRSFLSAGDKAAIEAKY